MSQLLTIFKKIEDTFHENYLNGEQEGNFKLIFAPISAGFHYDDFLFLDTNMASEAARRYIDELNEFSQIANTIPRQNNFWTTSVDQEDYLFNVYNDILRNLQLLDPDTLTAKMLYNHPIFTQALQNIEEDDQQLYKVFFDVHQRLEEKIEKLRSSINDKNREIVDKIKAKNLKTNEERWEIEGKKKEVEDKILEIIRDEFKRFLRDLDDIKSMLDSSKRTHLGSGATFYLTSCSPNNLYRGEEVNWTSIKIDKNEIQTILQKNEKEEFEEILGDSNLNRLEIEEISFELLFVNVIRPWFDPDLLSSSFWDINILDQKEIDIPRYTCNLIFIKDLNIKLFKNSEKNHQILKKNTFQNFGPFIFDTKQLINGRNIKLKSFNTALKIERNTVFNVSSNIKNKIKTTGNNPGSIIKSKQKQFVRLAPILLQKTFNRNKISKSIKPPKAIKLAKPKKTIRPVMYTVKNLKLFPAKSLIQKIKVNLNFRDADTNTILNIQKENIKVKIKNEPVEIKFSKDSSGITGSFNKGHTYILEVTHDGYQPLSVTMEVSLKGNKNEFSQTYKMQKEIIEEEADSDVFQLIGVVTQVINDYPTPIESADYL